MNVTVLTLVVGTLSLGALAGAQTPITPPSAQVEPGERDDVTIIGCLEKSKSGGFWLTSATKGDAPTGTSGVATDPQRPSSTAENTKGMVYNLEDGKDLDQHVGHRMEFSGRVDDTKSSDRLKDTPGDREIHAQDFHVESQRMVAASCSQR